eukprot:CAMPEP_0113890604 /NCGR_PEP_ID=MMETSP0780_2-20120614/14242_1 /TAXON_ID=652834 /ORGANISM="Palpitomonas bilix" /LENGTH=42 /DNA_ID=CAMNT_0000880027 /DNA_START=50 /DNA_END=175 /DNA_ORIENTATION=+ /assembly_acc=CAM_ASM_000599
MDSISEKQETERSATQELPQEEGDKDPNYDVWVDAQPSGSRR